MRGLRSFLGLVVVLIGLGAYLYFVESKRTPGDDGPKKEKVFNVESDKIEEISIRSESGEQTTLRKSGSEWQIVADENASDLKEYGLAEPRVQVTFKAGGQSQTLQIGQKTPPGSDLYAK